jgi:hypothetical protein
MANKQTAEVEKVFGTINLNETFTGDGKFPFSCNEVP